MSNPNLYEKIFDPVRADRMAILYEDAKISYDDLREETKRAAEKFRALGLAVGDRVALLLHDSPELVATFIGACATGVVAIPINVALRADEHRFILNDSDARVAITEVELCRPLLDGLREASPHLEKVLVVRRNVVDELPQAAGIKVSWWEDVARSALDNDFPVRPPEASPGFILYTSGSTGEPKGAVHCQQDILHTVKTFCREVLSLKPTDRIFSSSRLPFAYGLGNSLSFPLVNGATVIICREKPLPEMISRVFSRYHPTVFFGVPLVYNLLLNHHKQGSTLDCSSVRLCISAGEALPAQIGEEWQSTFGVEVLDGIGSTEILHIFISNRSGSVRYGSSGQLVKGYEARLLSPEGEQTPDNEAGHLWIRGASAATGYWRRPDATEQTFIDGWVRTGDLYRRDNDGYFYHLGRSDDCFKSSGQWVSPVEVEGVLLRHAGVREVAVVEGLDANGLSCVCAFVVEKESGPGVEALEQQLRELAKRVLPRFKQPRRYITVETLPYTATGKIQRFKLREQLCAEALTVRK